MRDKSLGNCDGSITILTKYIESDRQNNGKICRSIAHTDFGTIFFEHNIFHPMKAIFDTPLAKVPEVQIYLNLLILHNISPVL